MKQIKLPQDKKKFLMPGLSLLLLASVLVALYFFSQYQKTQSLLKNPTATSASEVKEITEKVGVLIELPKGEEPTVATVSDKNKLKDQAFFKNAENGDKVLIYTKAKKAILYRPSTNKIIEVAPVNLGEGTPSAAPAASPSVSPTPSTFIPFIPTSTPLPSPSPTVAP